MDKIQTSLKDFIPQIETAAALDSMNKVAEWAQPFVR